MESTFALSAPSHHHLKIPKSLPRNPRNLPNLFNLSSSSSSRSRTFDSISINAVSASSFSTSSSSSSSQRFGGSWISAPFVRRRNGFNIQAASVPENVGEDSKPKSGVVETVKLGLLFVLWYLVNIYFNIVNKQVLKAYPFPMTLSAIQFGIGTVIILFMWILNLHKKPNISTLQLLAILPLAIAHTLGNLFTNVSLVKVAVSFTHTIKAMEPFFTVILSALFLGEMPTLWVVSSLVPIVGGVALASATEASFDWLGFSSAMASNLTNQSRNVFSKKLMGKKEESMDNITLFSIITIMSFILTVPVALFMEGVKFTPSYMHYAGINVNEMYRGCLLSGICYHAYQQISYMILQKVSPVTHAVSNCLKRVVVIVASVLFFQTPVSPVNSLGTGVALVGVFLYSRVKQIKPKPKTL